MSCVLVVLVFLLINIQLAVNINCGCTPDDNKYCQNGQYTCDETKAFCTTELKATYKLETIDYDPNEDKRKWWIQKNIPSKTTYCTQNSNMQISETVQADFVFQVTWEIDRSRFNSAKIKVEYNCRHKESCNLGAPTLMYTNPAICKNYHPDKLAFFGDKIKQQENVLCQCRDDGKKIDRRSECRYFNYEKFDMSSCSWDDPECMFTDSGSIGEADAMVQCYAKVADEYKQPLRCRFICKFEWCNQMEELQPFFCHAKEMMVETNRDRILDTGVGIDPFGDGKWCG